MALGELHSEVCSKSINVVITCGMKRVGDSEGELIQGHSVQVYLLRGREGERRLMRGEEGRAHTHTP